MELVRIASAKRLKFVEPFLSASGRAAVPVVKAVDYKKHQG